jgi:glycerol-3-phosphate acyltransferase PlsY
MNDFWIKILLNNDPGIGYLPTLFGIQATEDGTFISSSPAIWLAFLTIAFAILAYFLGSINFAVLISKLFYREDIRDFGSHNAGTTNMKRIYGWKAAGMTLLGDILKGVVSCLIPRLLISTSAAYLAGLCCIIGHCFPAYFKFKGGKGVATAAAVIVTLNPAVGGITLLIFLVIVLGTRYVSLGSIMAALFFPVLLDRIHTLIYNQSPTLLMTVCSLLMAILIIVNHHANIKRLLAGKENKLSFQKGGEKKKDE